MTILIDHLSYLNRILGEFFMNNETPSDSHTRMRSEQMSCLLDLPYTNTMDNLLAAWIPGVQWVTIVVLRWRLASFEPKNPKTPKGADALSC
ncbi:hypothetical protein PENARI_c085G09787 [Penicillium arizonense]|uniref:Uncharacterized protein n=1 Tax=Penicillium arizonense TaxID=1835702 RepID=A0A1F5L1V3_PENAI|nr:hypothetical protein PENARI_c085G09787 [Penicillium arizonense]OGE46939.1 hypothetical protein PENARI_c085G09787 [Penicillium arizonense]